jgi:hypothetical protein
MPDTLSQLLPSQLLGTPANAGLADCSLHLNARNFEKKHTLKSRAELYLAVEHSTLC